MGNTPNIHLEPYAINHVELLYTAVVESLADLIPFLQWSHPDYQADEARQFVLLQIENFQAGKSFEFAIMSEEGVYLGGCGLNQVDSRNRRANLGYWVRSSATGKGVATAAVRELECWAWANTDLIRLEIVAATENLASCRVAEKAGALFEGIAASRLMLHGKAHDARIYSLIRPAAQLRRFTEKTMKIRPVEDQDIVSVVELMQSNWDGIMSRHHSPGVVAKFRGEVTPDWLRRQMGWKRIFVVEESGEIRATGALADFGVPGAPRLSVSQFFVRPDLHGKGIGKYLLSHLVGLARGNGCNRLHVPSSRNAVPFYVSAGFVVDAAQPDAADEITWMTMELAMSDLKGDDHDTAETGRHPHF